MIVGIRPLLAGACSCTTCVDITWRTHPKVKATNQNSNTMISIPHQIACVLPLEYLGIGIGIELHRYGFGIGATLLRKA